MSKKRPVNIAASVRQRLLDKARTDKRTFSELLQYFAMEGTRTMEIKRKRPSLKIPEKRLYRTLNSKVNMIDYLLLMNKKSNS